MSQLLAPAPDLDAGSLTNESSRTMSASAERGPRPRLRRILFLLDTVGLSAAWMVALTLEPSGVRLPVAGELTTILSVAAIGVFAGLAALVTQQLYLARVCAIRAVELTRLGRVAAVSGVIVAIGAPELLDTTIPTGRIVLAGLLGFITLAVFRGLFASWLKTRRSEGSFSRSVVIVGTNEDGFEVSELLNSHPELGFRVVGVVGDPGEARRWDPEIPWLGTSEHALQAVTANQVDGVVVVGSALACGERNRLIRDCHEARIHVQLASGLSGMDYRRVRALPLAHETFFYVEPASLRRWQIAVKRTIDIVLASVGLIVALPVMVIAAVAIKVGSRGPIFFRQQRVGRDQEPFTLYKLRSMVPDAVDHLDQVMELNERQGPLFKAEFDPRVTRVGRFLRASSIDELPQLFNVLTGSMSLVGPRPALPREVAQFDEALLGRLKVRPGMTGLWQVEARGNPSYYAYRHLDIFYADNWSPFLDFVILFQTVPAVLGSAVRAAMPTGSKVSRAQTPAIALEGPAIALEGVAAEPV